MVRPDSKWLPGKKAQGNIIVPAATLVAAAERKNKKTEM